MTGGAGLLGVRHAEAIAAAGGMPVLADIRGATPKRAPPRSRRPSAAGHGHRLRRHARGVGRGAAARPSSRGSAASTSSSTTPPTTRRSRRPARPSRGSSTFRSEQWDADLAVGLTGPFLCAKIIGGALARRSAASSSTSRPSTASSRPTSASIGRTGCRPTQQPVKPVTYTVVKAGLHGLTIYLATYWADAGVRVNTITLGGVESGQPAAFLERAAARIPMGRMAQPHDFQGALVYLCSDAAAFVTGANLVVDGGKTIW